MLCRIQLNCTGKLVATLDDIRRNIHEDHISGTGVNSLSHYRLVHKFIPMLEALKIPEAKAAVEKEWENSRKYRHVN